MQRVEIAGVELAVRVCRGQDQRRQSLTKSKFAISEFFMRWRLYTLHHKTRIQIAWALFLIVAGGVSNGAVVAGRPGHGSSSFRLWRGHVDGLSLDALNYADNAHALE